jgi:hypothetical protein
VPACTVIAVNSGAFRPVERVALRPSIGYDSLQAGEIGSLDH